MKSRSHSSALRAGTLTRALARSLGPAAARSQRAGATGDIDLTRALDVGMTCHAPSVAATAADRIPRLLHRIDVSERLIRLLVSRPPGFVYRAGQHTKLGVGGVTRTYSLASAPHEPQLEFFIELFPGGRLSQQLRTLRPGATMSVAERAKGGLRIDVSHPIQLMIATATGIAPYVGLLRDHLHRTNASVGRLRFVILHGASHADEFGYREELETLTRRYPDKLLYVPTVSRPASPRNRDWDGARGRVERHIEPTLRRLALNPGNTALFACGNPDMVRNVSEQYRKLGFTTQVEAFD